VTFLWIELLIDLLVHWLSGDVSGAMQAVAQLTVDAFDPDDDAGSQHIINHFNGHRILKRLIANDSERMKDNRQTSKSYTALSYCATNWQEVMGRSNQDLI